MPVPLWRVVFLNRFLAHCEHEDCLICRQQKMLHTEYKRLDAEL